jgi:NDP-sugar pyrophosphorylase family protein
MKAMLLAAGLGARLKPLTDQKPKALVEVGGITLLERAVGLLKRHGVDEIILNVHHFAGLIEEFLEEKGHFGLKMILSDEREQLLDTGGGLKKAAWFFEDGAPFFVYNVDILTDLDLSAMYRAHGQSGCLATLAVRRRTAGRYLLFDGQMTLLGWCNRNTGETRWCGPGDRAAAEYAFSGIQVFDPAIFRYFPDMQVFSLVELYLRAGAAGRVCGYAHDDSLWMDAGKIQDLEQAEEMAKKIG